MKKNLIALVIVLLSTLLLGLILLIGFVSVLGMIYGGDPILESLPKYTGKEYYSSGGFGDFTDYGKYTFSSVDAGVLEGTGYFKEADPEDLQAISAYMDNFENWVTLIGGELEQGYDFDRSLMSSGDFYCLRTKEGEPVGTGGNTYKKFDNYTLYYFHMASGILYYFHSNI